MPLFRRISASMLMLAFSTALSLSLGIALNRQDQAMASGTLPIGMDSWERRVLDEPWQSLELSEAGVMEFPAFWYVEDSNGRVHRVENRAAVQYMREALRVFPYGQRRNGPNFSLEVFVYWWTRPNGRILPPPEEALFRVQEHQFQLLKNGYSDIVSYTRSRAELQGRKVNTMTAETRLVPGYLVRFKNIVFQDEHKLYLLVVSYPADEERIWEITLDRMIWRWVPVP